MRARKWRTNKYRRLALMSGQWRTEQKSGSVVSCIFKTRGNRVPSSQFSAPALIISLILVLVPAFPIGITCNSTPLLGTLIHINLVGKSSNMFIESWDEFAEAASRMFLADPKNVRLLSLRFLHIAA